MLAVAVAVAVAIMLAAGLSVGGAPLLLLLVAPWRWGVVALRLLWALGRLWPPPLTALLLLFVLKPSLPTAALALGFHNLGILGRLLLEGSEATGPAAEQALLCAGSGPRLALLYGRFSGLARSYLAYGAYRADVILRETVMGRELFDRAFKEYANRWRFKHPTPYDFFRTMEESSGIDLD